MFASMMIIAVEQRGEPMSDLISRQTAIEALNCRKDKSAKGDIGSFYNKIIENDIDAINALPSAEPRKGKWVQKSKPLDLCTEWWYECSECGSRPLNDRYGHPYHLSNFCPNCGADMRGEEDERNKNN